MELATSKQAGYRKVGGWIELNVLGAGGFGTVTRWQNEETGENIALKRCQVEKDINTKQRRRWEMEVDIMKRLDHPNVIVAKDVPPPLDVSKDVMPLLAMEYCSGGDLRKVLSRPENCCGLPEAQVRCLAQDISSAIEYLHSKRIIHRDLKPENIVLQPDGETTVYKLIDLGYAKELDQGSVCTSFVGTLQYLAPELFSSQRYSCTVDYWSFGTVVFECITGIRPFLPSFSPVRWHSEVIQKSDDHICASVDSKGAVKFSNKLPTPNRLCRILQVYFEKWLRLVLRWNPTTRGGRLTEKGRPECFTLLEDILALKTVHVLDISSNQLKSYAVKDQDRVRNLLRLISTDIKVAVENLELLLPNGIHPDPNKHIVPQCCGKPGEDDHMVFLFRVGQEKLETSAKPFPPLVQNIVKEPRTLLPYIEQRRAWAEAVHFCQEQAADLRALVLGQRAAMINLLRKNSSFFQSQKKMIKDYEQFCAKVEFFKTSLEDDQLKYKEQEASGGITSERMFTKWNETNDEAKQFSEGAKVACDLVDKSRALHTKIVELNKSPYSKAKQTQVLNELTEQAQKLFQELRATPKEKRSTLSDHSRMVRVLHKCVMASHKAIEDLYTYLGQVSSCKQDLDDLSPQIQNVSTYIQNAVSKLAINQRKRQNDIWQLLKKALSRVGGGCPGVGMLQQELKGDITTTTTQPLSGSSAFESVQIMDDSRKTQEELSILFSSLALEQADSIKESMLNWDFIKDS